jgi:hypothetical protein
VQSNRSSIALKLPSDSPLLGLRLSGSDSFALKFTIEGAAPQPAPESEIGAGALVDLDESGPWGEAPVFLRLTSTSAAISDTGTGAAVIKKLGIVFYVPPAYKDKLPTAGGTVNILAEPAPNAIPIEEIGKLK